MKIFNHAVCVFALFPSVAHSKNLRREKGQHKAPEDYFVGVAPLDVIKHAALSNQDFAITKIDSTTGEISNVRDLEEDVDGTTDSLMKTYVFHGKEKQAPMRGYTASCFPIDKAGTRTCSIYVGSSIDFTPREETSNAMVDRFCSPSNDLGNCSYYGKLGNDCIDGRVDISNDTCAEEGYTCVASIPDCIPPNEFACGYGYTSPVSCAHSIDCTGSDGEANQTVCEGLNMRCFDLCGPIA